MAAYKIMIIEDDPVISSELKNMLCGNGYDVVTVLDTIVCGKEADGKFSVFHQTLEEVREQTPHLIILDIKMPGTDGFSLCSGIRAFSNVPIVFVTSCNTDMDELNSIMLGGDAYITKPYNTAILLAKIASLLKRAYPTDNQEVIQYQETFLHLENSTLEFRKQQIDLTKNELKIMYYLYKNAGKICSRNDLIDFLWDNRLYVDDNALSVNVNRIRDKLSSIGLHDFIRTKHRQGYFI